MAKISGFLQNNIFSPYNSETVPIIMIMVATCSRTASLAIATGFAVAADASGLGQVAYAPMRWVDKLWRLEMGKTLLPPWFGARPKQAH